MKRYFGRYEKVREVVTVVVLFALAGAVVQFSCKKNDEDALVYVTVCPESPETELFFRGYVTDDEEELVSQIHNFSRKIVGPDTIDGRAVYVFESDGQRNYFYTDEQGTVWQKVDENISNRVVIYGYSYREPVVLSRWRVLLKQTEGKGTEWSENIDTTFTVISKDGQEQAIRYIHRGRAKNNGWQNAFVPATYRYEKALDAYWYELQTFLLNQSTGDTLFSSAGTAHQYFVPDVGAVKYMTDFIKKEKGKPAESLHGTWELVRTVL